MTYMPALTRRFSSRARTSHKALQSAHWKQLCFASNDSRRRPCKETSCLLVLLRMHVTESLKWHQSWLPHRRCALTRLKLGWSVSLLKQFATTERVRRWVAKIPPSLTHSARQNRLRTSTPLYWRTARILQSWSRSLEVLTRKHARALHTYQSQIGDSCLELASMSVQRPTNRRPTSSHHVSKRCWALSGTILLINKSHELSGSRNLRRRPTCGMLSEN